MRVIIERISLMYVVCMRHMRFQKIVFNSPDTKVSFSSKFCNFCNNCHEINRYNTLRTLFIRFNSKCYNLCYFLQEFLNILKE